MAQRQIPNLTPAIFLSPTANIEIVQDGSTYRASVGQIADLIQDKIDVTNDVVENQSFFPLFSRITNGQVEVLYASDPHYNYNPFFGLLSAIRHESTQGIHLNRNATTQNYTFPTGDNGLSAGPVAISAVINVPAGSTWKIV